MNFTALAEQKTADQLKTIWVARDNIQTALRELKKQGYEMLYDLTAVDERLRTHRAVDFSAESFAGRHDYTVVYHLLSVSKNQDIRLKVPLSEGALNLPTVTSIYPNANWYEREVWDLFGIVFDGHPLLRRIMTLPNWEGHPLRKDYHARATEYDAFTLQKDRQALEQDLLMIRPEDWGFKSRKDDDDDSDLMYLNLGPNHPSAHGAFRVVLQLDGEVIHDCAPDIGYHHRGAEKMGERQSWHTYIPYTDRIDYLGGVMNNLPYVLTVEKLAGIQVPERVECIRVLLCELFRIGSHLLFWGTYAQDFGIMSPVFYMFTDRQKVFDIIEAITGFRMHPAFFRIGGVAYDLPKGWDKKVQELLDWLPKRLDEYVKMTMDNKLLQARARGVGLFDKETALAWGATGPMLRATGVNFDLRKARPYSGYQNYDFQVPTGNYGDCFDRCLVRIEEIRQSLKIIKQCLNHMPSGNFKADHPLTTPPVKQRTLKDIETLITHFLGVSWGPVIPPGEAEVMVEATKGINSYYLVSDGNTMSYRTRIRTPSFAHLQMIPLMARGGMIPDLIAVLASIDFVMADVDR